MKTKITLLGLLILLSFLSIKFTFADVYIPSPPDDCKEDEIYFKEGDINADDYTKIRSVIFNEKNLYGFKINEQKGFCVNREEYCSKNNCNLNETAEIFFQKLIFSPSFHIKNVVINLIINSILILLIHFLSKANIKVFYKIKSLIKVFIITVLGYFYDYLAIYMALAIGRLTIYLHYKFDPAEIITGTIPLISLVIIVFILVSLTFYFLYSKIVAVEKKKRLIYSLIFGVLSNPIWYILYKLILTGF